MTGASSGPSESNNTASPTRTMVNALRAHLPAGVEYRVGEGGRHREQRRCSACQADRGRGDYLTTGRGGFRQQPEARSPTWAAAPCDPEKPVLCLRIHDRSPLHSQPFDFDSVTYYSLEPSARIDYLTLFKIRQTMRANLFVFRSATDPWVREFILEPERMLRRCLPKLDRVTGDFRIVSKIESGGAISTASKAILPARRGHDRRRLPKRLPLHRHGSR